MSEIIITHNPETSFLDSKQVKKWPIWEKEVSEFPWSYESTEECYILRGEVKVTPEGGQPVTLKAGDFVVFPEGMSCWWSIRKDIKKHYNFI